MKVGTKMDPFQREPSRRYGFNPNTVEVVELPEEEEVEEEPVDTGPAPINYDEPEPDDPDAA